MQIAGAQQGGQAHQRAGAMKPRIGFGPIGDRLVRREGHPAVGLAVEHRQPFKRMVEPGIDPVEQVAELVFDADAARFVDQSEPGLEGQRRDPAAAMVRIGQRRHHGIDGARVSAA